MGTALRALEYFLRKQQSPTKYTDEYVRGLSNEDLLVKEMQANNLLTEAVSVGNIDIRLDQDQQSEYIQQHKEWLGKLKKEIVRRGYD